MKMSAAWRKYHKRNGIGGENERKRIKNSVSEKEMKIMAMVA